MIVCQDTTDGIAEAMLQGFFEGWTRPHDPKAHLRILQNSDFIVLAVDTADRRVVGFVTAITDRVQSAFVPLLEVLPAYRKQGIGTQLMHRMLDKLKGIPAIDIMCDPDVQPFYQRLGMRPSVGVMLRNY